MSNFSKEYKIKAVSDFKAAWEQNNTVSIQSFADNELRVHYTTLRNWVVKYDPELLESVRKYRSHKSQQQTITLDNPPESGLKVVTESYKYDEETSFPVESPDNGMVYRLRDQIESLKTENTFLKKCVAYWTNQAMPQESVL